MKTNPVFCGHINVNGLENGLRYSGEYKTLAKNDAEIGKFVKSLNLKSDSYAREEISTENGKALCNLIEKAIGKKLDIPDNVRYSALGGTSSVLFACEELPNAKEKKLWDCNRTYFDIYFKA